MEKNQDPRFGSWESKGEKVNQTCKGQWLSCMQIEGSMEENQDLWLSSWDSTAERIRLAKVNDFHQPHRGPIAGIVKEWCIMAGHEARTQQRRVQLKIQDHCQIQRGSGERRWGGKWSLRAAVCNLVGGCSFVVSSIIPLHHSYTGVHSNKAVWCDPSLCRCGDLTRKRSHRWERYGSSSRLMDRLGWLCLTVGRTGMIGGG